MCAALRKIEFVAPHDLDDQQLHDGCAFPRRPTWVKPSMYCPSREDLFHTLPAERYSLWDDPSCTAGCRVDNCLQAGVPCCVRRQRVTWPMPCEYMPFKCHGAEDAPFTQMGLSVHDLNDPTDPMFASPVPRLLPLTIAPLLVVAAALLWRAWVRRRMRRVSVTLSQLVAASLRSRSSSSEDSSSEESPPKCGGGDFKCREQ